MIDLAPLDVGSGVSYAIAILVPMFDALIPLLPSETVVIALGIATAGRADPRIALLVGLAALGAFLGDNAVYLLGQRYGSAISRRVFAGERGARRRSWAQQSLDRYGARIIVVCRFIPGGRTAVTLTCGLIGYPRRSFVAATACAGIIWAAYAFFIGRARREGLRRPALGRAAARPRAGARGQRRNRGGPAGLAVAHAAADVRARGSGRAAGLRRQPIGSMPRSSRGPHVAVAGRRADAQRRLCRPTARRAV